MSPTRTTQAVKPGKADRLACKAVAVIDLGSSFVKLFILPLASPEVCTRLGAWRTAIRHDSAGASVLDVNALDDILVRTMSSLAQFEATSGMAVSVLAITGQVGGFVLLDHDGQPHGQAMSTADTRCARASREMHESLAARFPSLLGHHLPEQTCWLVPKLRHLRETQPRLCDETSVVLPPPAYLFERLTGQRASTPDLLISLAHQFKHHLSPEVIEWAGWHANQFPSVSQQRPRGSLLDRWKQATGQLQSCEVVLSGGDMLCGVQGLALEAGQTFIQCGTTEIAGAAVEALTQAHAPGVLVRLPLSINHADTLQATQPLHVIYGSTNNGGASLAWLGEHHDINLDDPKLWRQAQKLSPEPDGLVFMPHVYGVRAPHWRTGTQGGFMGQADHLPRETLLRAVLEGCAMNKLAVLEATGQPLRSVVLAGGGARQHVANQIRANVLGCDVIVCHASEVTALGAAAAAMVACDLFSPSQATQWLRDIHHLQGQTKLSPDAKSIAIYQQLRQRFLALEQQVLANAIRPEKEAMACLKVH